MTTKFKHALLLKVKKQVQFLEKFIVSTLRLCAMSNLNILSWFMTVYLYLFDKLVPGKPEVSVGQPKETVVVSWTLKEKKGVIKEYHVTYVSEDDSSETKTLITKKMEAQFDLKAGKTYEFQVGRAFSIV